MLVVIAEDEEILAKALKEKFEAEGFKVLIAKDGQEAVDILKGSPKPDLILLDLIMPVKDGFAVLEAMAQQNVEIRNIPVIVLSNLSEDESIKRALKLGATDYFVKSQHPLSEVVQRVKQVLKKVGAAELQVVEKEGAKKPKAQKSAKPVSKIGPRVLDLRKLKP